MALLLLLAAQFAIMIAGFVWLWRRIDRLNAEIAQLRRAQAAAATRRVVKRASGAETAVSRAVEENAYEAGEEHNGGPIARAARAWGLPPERIALGFNAPTLSPEAGRGLVLALVAIAPALGFFFGAPASLVVCAGLAVAATLMLVSLRPMWRAAAWAAVLTAGAWALLGFAIFAAHATPLSYSVLAGAAAASGLIHAHLRRAAPGAAMALAMSAAVLALASQTGMAGPAGMAFGLIVATAAVVGAMSLRLEAIHLAAFGAALIGLFVLSGEASAAIWFTPAAAWAGALFLAVALVRVPQVGARGVAIAGSGVLAPLAAIAALYGAQQGLANPYAAAAAFAALAAIVGGLIAVSAARRERGVAALRLVLWVLCAGAFAAVSGAILLALPAPLAAPAFMAVALALCLLNLRIGDAAWRAFACLAALAAIAQAWIGGAMLLGEAQPWAAWQLILAGFAAPALLAAVAARFALQAKAPVTGGWLEAAAIILSVVAANLGVRVLFSGGATLLQPLSFVEAGAHSAVWLFAALLCAARARRGAGEVRMAAALLLGAAALIASAGAALLWTGEYWRQHAAALPPPWSWQTLGFVLPAIMFWAHWVFWRARGSQLRTRIAIAAAAMLSAAAVTMEALRTLPDWAGALAGALSIALAIGINFAPGVTSHEPRRR